MEYPFHKGARTALRVLSGLLVLLVFTIPIAIWIWVRVNKGKVTLTDSGVLVSGLGSNKFDYGEVARLGTIKVAVNQPGLGGMLARQRMGGSQATHVFAKMLAGKDQNFIVSQYENYQAIMDEISRRTGKPFEQMKSGAFGAKWPE